MRLPNPSRINRKTARTFLHRFLFSGNQVFNRTDELSRGEQAKLLIASFAANELDFLILDEPTNNMDVQSIECLRNALLAFQGALLVISHDRQFIKEIGIERCWEISGGCLTDSEFRLILNADGG